MQMFLQYVGKTKLKVESNNYRWEENTVGTS